MKETSLAFVPAVRGAVLGILALASCGVQSADAQAEKRPTAAQKILNLQPRHATLSVADLEAESAWYRKILGFSMRSRPQPAAGNQKIRGVQLTAPGYQIHLIQYQGSKRAKPVSPPFLAQGWIHIAFSVADIDTAFSFLQSAGADVTAVRDKDGELGTLVLHDPEGNEIELFPR